MSLIREATYAGRFYPADAAGCDALAAGWLADAAAQPAIAGLAPHAGWLFSGATAALSIAAIAAFKPDTVVVFGAVHVVDRNRASLYPAGRWRTPYGDLPVDEELARAVSKIGDVTVDPAAHRNEHSIEVELPIIRQVMEGVAILPIMVRPGPWASDVGREVARAAMDMERRVAFLASTDLTHYGPSFGFEPHGRGPDGIQWAKDVNDRRFIDIVAQLDAGAIVPEADEHRNACGSGAVAATIAAVIESGPVEYCELGHTTSSDIELSTGQGERLDSVGYHAGVFIQT